MRIQIQDLSAMLSGITPNLWELLGKAHRQIRLHGVIDCYSLVAPQDREASHHSFSRFFFWRGGGYYLVYGERHSL